jgi:hypothetical protein
MLGRHADVRLEAFDEPFRAEAGGVGDVADLTD